MKQGAVIITGIKEIDRKLAKLPGRIQKKVARQSMRAGLKIVQAEMKSQIPVDTGLARSNVKVRALKRSRTRIGMEVRIKAAEGLINQSGSSGKPFFYPAGIEYGDSTHTPNPFGRRSYASAGPKAATLTKTLVIEGVEREAAKP